jgi:HAD superfamily hydrolase (TIGR01490 family)
MATNPGLKEGRRATDTILTMTEAAFFDLDKTIIAGSSTLAFGKPLYRAGFLQRGTLLRLGVAQISYMLFGADEDSLERARDEMLDLVSGWHRAEVDAIVAQTLDDVIEPLVFAEALFLIDEHKRAGREVYVVSASPEEFVRPIAALVGIDRVIATKIRTDGLGRYVPELERYVMGPGKADAMRDVAERDGIDLEGSFAYTDSFTDMPMLEAVGNPVPVNPDKELREAAEEREWPTLEFQRPVSLGPRVPAPPPKAWMAAAGGIAIAAAVAYVALSRRRPPS